MKTRIWVAIGRLSACISALVVAWVFLVFVMSLDCAPDTGHPCRLFSGRGEEIVLNIPVLVP